MINVQNNICLAPYTTFRIGGPAKYFCLVKNESELKEALTYAKDNKLKYFVLGGGSNLLVSDQGYDGLVIKIEINNYVFPALPSGSQGTEMECGAGLNLSNAVRIAKEDFLSGLEWAAGIPGTVGGAIYGNAGAFGKSIAENIKNIRVLNIDEGNEYKIENYSKEDCVFGYRDSIFKKNKNLIILSAVFQLERGEAGAIEDEMKENIKKRAKKQPAGFSAGSFFKNPIVKNRDLIIKFEQDTGAKVKDDKLPAGWLVSEAGFLGRKIGQIQVSEKHGNFILNLGDGKAEDVIMLMSMIKQKVRTEFNVQLSEEIIFLGF
jgi:UDP-N-acetylmuramate dehydrogenase